MDHTTMFIPNYTDSVTTVGYDYEEPIGLLLALKIILCLIFLVGVFSNGSIVILMVIYGFHNVSDVFIGILCTANILFLVIFTPLEISEFNPHGSSLFICRLVNTMNVYFCAVSVLSLVVLSYERCSAVIRPMSSRSSSTKSTAVKIILVILLAGVLSAPFWFVYQRVDNRNTPDETFFEFAVYSTTVTMYVCPLILIAAMYTCMAATLMHTAASLQESTQNRHVQSRRNRVSWIVIGLVISFAICWFPFYLYLMIIVTGADLPRLMYFLAYFRQTIYTLNTCSDPLSIYLLGSRFRQNLQKALCRKKKKKKQENLTLFQSFSSKQTVAGKSTSLSV